MTKDIPEGAVLFVSPLVDENDPESEIDTYQFLHEGHWDYSGKSAPVDTNGDTYTVVGQFLQNDDFYQGLHKMAVFVRDRDGALFGHEFFDDISKHGETFIEPDGYDYLEYVEGYEQQAFLFYPVEHYTIDAYDYA